MDARGAVATREPGAGDPQCRCLVAVGGDGTVVGPAQRTAGRPLTVLPAGTENLVARHFGLGVTLKALARTIAAGRPVRVDVGLVGGRRFLLMAGFGFDGEIVSRHHQGTGVPRRARSGPPTGSPTFGPSYDRALPTGSRRSRCGSLIPGPRRS